MPTISAGGVVIGQACAKSPPASAASRRCLGRMTRLSSSRMPGPNGCGKVTTTVAASGVSTAIGLPSTVREMASWLLAKSASAACTVKATSAELNGAPSDQRSPGRRVRVKVRPSGLVVHRSASHGSTCWVARLTRTRRPWASSAITSLTRSRATSRLNDRGSARTEATSRPPRCDRFGGRALAGVHGRPPEAPSPGQSAADEDQDEQRARLSVHGLADRTRNWPINCWADFRPKCWALHESCGAS